MEIFLIILLITVLGAVVFYWLYRSNRLKAHQACPKCAKTLAEHDKAANELILIEKIHQTQLKAESRCLEELRSEYNETLEKLDNTYKERDTARQQLAALKADHEARIQELAKAREQIDIHFKAISADVIRKNNATFLEQAKEQFSNQQRIGNSDLEKRQEAITTIVKPMSENLDKLQQRINELEEKREGAYKSLEKELDLLRNEASNLRGAANTLSESMKSSRIRGMWGEHQLRRVLELSGMIPHVDFIEQHSLSSQGQGVRPDAVVHVPGGIKVVIDAKVPMHSYLEARSTKDRKAQTDYLKKHAQLLVGHARTLSTKEYPAALGVAPDFTLMFVPADPILDAAMEVQPNLWDDVWAKHHVLIATPGLLLAFLRTVALAWQQQNLTDNAQEIAELGKEMYKRLQTYFSHIEKLGTNIGRTVKAYNDSVGSIKTRLLPHAQKFEDLVATSHISEADRIALPPEIEVQPR